MVTTADPVASRLVDSLARPGGNITGLTRLTRDLSGKRLELLKEAVPRISRVGVLWDATTAGILLKILRVRGARTKDRASIAGGARSTTGFGRCIPKAAAKGRVNALITGTGAVTISYRKAIADLAMKNRIPFMCERSDYVEAGCLMSYSADEVESYRRAAIQMDKILKGTKPADIPVEQPTKFEMVINLKTAQEIGLTIPPNVLMRADKVIK